MPTSYPVYVRGMEGQQVDVLLPGFASGPKLLVNGVPASPGMAKNQYLLVTNDGQQLVAQLKPGFVDPIPKMTINGYPILIAEPFQWYEWIWACAPFGLICMGALGGAIGGFATVANGMLLRADLPVPTRYLLSGLVSAAAVAIDLGATFFLWSKVGGR